MRSVMIVVSGKNNVIKLNFDTSTISSVSNSTYVSSFKAPLKNRLLNKLDHDDSIIIIIIIIIINNNNEEQQQRSRDSLLILIVNMTPEYIYIYIV